MRKGRMADRRIRLLFAVNGFAIGGAEKKLFELVQHLDPTTYRIWVCGIGQGGPLESAFRSLGVEVLVLPKRGRWDFSLVPRLAQILRRHRIQLVQTTLWLADIVGTLAALLAGGIPVVSWETVTHGENDVLRVKRRHVLLYRAMVKFIKRIVAVSEEIRDSLIDRRHVSPNRVCLLHYGVDLRKFSPQKASFTLRKSLGLNRTQRVVGTVARLEPYKGVDYLLDAAIRLTQKHPDLVFLFVGDGSLRQAMEARTAQARLADRIRFLGFREEVNQIVSLFDVFVLPSLSEGLPNAVLEAMAAKKPVIATRVGGVPEAVIDGITGVLVPPADVEALEQAIEQVISSPELLQKMGEAGRKRVEEAFSLEQEIAGFERLYQALARPS